MSHRSGAAATSEDSESSTLPSVDLLLPAAVDGAPLAATNAPPATSKHTSQSRRRVRFVPHSLVANPVTRRWQRGLPWFALGVFACLAAVTAGASRFSASPSPKAVEGLAATAGLTATLVPALQLSEPPADTETGAEELTLATARTTAPAASSTAPSTEKASASTAALTRAPRRAAASGQPPKTKTASAFDRPLAPPD
jgi:hypothetical protein